MIRFQIPEKLFDGNGDAVCLLPHGASATPDTDGNHGSGWGMCHFTVQEIRQNFVFEQFERGFVPEKERFIGGYAINDLFFQGSGTVFQGLFIEVTK